jgi:hypothetical protein
MPHRILFTKAVASQQSTCLFRIMAGPFIRCWYSPPLPIRQTYILSNAFYNLSDLHILQDGSVAIFHTNTDEVTTNIHHAYLDVYMDVNQPYMYTCIHVCTHSFVTPVFSHAMYVSEHAIIHSCMYQYMSIVRTPFLYAHEYMCLYLYIHLSVYAE